MTKDEWTDLRIKTIQWLYPKLTLEEATVKNSDPTFVVSELSNWSSPLTKEFNKRLRAKLQEFYRSNKTDIICVALGKTYQDAINGLNSINVENKIRKIAVSKLVSKVASIKEVRQKLVKEQRLMGEQGGVVMDGRDIGSVVFPNAELKLFITSDPQVRVERRFLELSTTDQSITRKEIEENLNYRDLLDTTREESPLMQAEDAIVIDNTNLNQEQQLDVAYNYVLAILKN